MNTALKRGPDRQLARDNPISHTGEKKPVEEIKKPALRPVSEFRWLPG